MRFSIRAHGRKKVIYIPVRTTVSTEITSDSGNMDGRVMNFQVSTVLQRMTKTVLGK